MIVSGILFLLFLDAITVFFTPLILGFNFVGIFFLLALFFWGGVFYFFGFPLNLVGDFFGLEPNWKSLFKDLAELARNILFL